MSQQGGADFVLVWDIAEGDLKKADDVYGCRATAQAGAQWLLPTTCQNAVWVIRFPSVFPTSPQQPTVNMTKI